MPHPRYGRRLACRPRAGRLVLLASALAASVTVSCGGGGAADGTSPAASIFTALALTPDDAAVTIGGTVQLQATPLDQRGNAMAGLPAPTFTSSAPATAQVDAAGMVTGVAAGSATVRATLTHGGVTATDSASVTVLGATAGRVTVTTPNRTFSPASVTIAPGDTVTWVFSGAVHNVTFAGAQPPGGHIGDTNPGASVDRVFPAAGTYDYDCTRHSGMTGRVIVQAAGGGTYSALAITPASAAIGVGDVLQFTATPLDENGAPLPGLPAASFSSSNSAIVSVTTAGGATGVATGSATITATLAHDNRTHTAAAAVTVEPSGGGSATVTTPNNTFSPERVTIAPGGTVTWQITGATHNITFTDIAPPGGSIPNTPPGNSVSRTFPVADSYDYECTLHPGMKGRVVVR